MQKGLLTAAETRRHVEALVRDHRFRIGVALYDSVMSRIARVS